MENIIWNPKEIEKNSMAIIENSMAPLDITPLEKSVVKRIVHTTGDVNIVPLIKFSPKAAQIGQKALKKGADVYTDVNMLATGISKKTLSQYGGQVYCGIADEEVAKMAKETGKTRASIAFRRWGERLNGQIVAVGNALTALFELFKMVDEGICSPALVIGTPVGFVGAKESKDELMETDLPYISIKGTRGGSNIAASIVNALLYHQD